MIRPEKPGDGSAIDRVHQLGFGRQDEAVLVNELRDSGGLAVSLVAEVEGQVIGHIALSPMTFDEWCAADGNGIDQTTRDQRYP